MSRSFSNNINDFNRHSFNTTIINNTSAIYNRSEILAWLSPLDPRSRHHDIRERRVENVGDWLLQTEEFRSWHAGSGGGESDNSVLFCYGNPGAGKTFISSLVIDWLCDRAQGQDFAVACFYFDFAARKEQSAMNVLGALLKQIVGGMEEVPEEIEQAFRDQGKVIDGQRPQPTDIVKMLQTATSEKRTFICIDALNECALVHQGKILDSLNQILQKSPGTRVFFTGRPHIRSDIGRRLAGSVTTIPIVTRRDDVIRYIRTRLDEDTDPDAMDSRLEADIIERISEDISEIFLLVSLNIDAILEESTIYRRRQRLSAMTNGLGLGDAYGATLARIKGQGGGKARLGMATLMWISHSQRPLGADELCHALAVEIGSANFDPENVPSIRTLLTCCQGLISVEASVIRLIHFTLQEYLRAHPEPFEAAHSTIAETCLSYLNSQQVRALSAGPFPGPRGTPFLEYSSLYWGIHAKRELSDFAKSLALELFGDYSNHISIGLFLRAQERYSYIVDSVKPSLFTGLHCASAFGIVEVVTSLVEMEGVDINQKDCTGSTPLMWAARGGHGRVVILLLGREGIEPDNLDVYGQTPLWRAALNGHGGVVEMLLRRDDVSSRLGEDRQTLFCCAAENGYEGAVKILLGRGDINPDKPDKLGRTPLFSAVWNGNEGVVEILLERGGVNPHKPGNDGQTLLCCAASNGHEGVVKILLGRDSASPDKPDDRGQTPLFSAASNGHEGVVKILLGRDDVNPHKPGNDGQTLLCCAASNGHEGVVEVLLGRDDINPGKPNKYGQTPLWHAAKSGHKGVVKILLGRDNTNPNKQDNRGQTPLHCAAMKGREGVVKMLLGRGDINPEKPDVYGQTPLFGAAENGREGVVKILLGREDVNPGKSNNDGQTPLFGAAWGGHEGVVKILLRQGNMNLDKLDKLGRTALWWAAKSGHAGVVALLQHPVSTGTTPSTG